MYKAVRLFFKRAAGKQKNFIFRLSRELLSLRTHTHICIYIYIYIYIYDASWFATPISEGFFPQKCPDRLRGYSSILLSGYWNSFPGINRLVREVNHLPSSGAEVKNEWSYTSSPPVNVHNMYRNNFIFLSRFSPFFIGHRGP